MKQFLIKTIKDAGHILKDNFRKDQSLVSLRKSAKDITTKYDYLSDELITERISEKYPNHNILTEESGDLDKKGEYTWLVDALDGTLNYSYENPLFCICIALLYKGELLMGAVNAPVIDELYFAEKDKGAYLNGQKLQVSKTKSFKNSYTLVCEGGEEDKSRGQKIFNEIYPKVIDARKLGSAGIETAWVAAGRADVLVITKIRPVDIAPGVLLVQEAGGKVTDFKGNDWDWEKEQSDLIFSNNLLHKKFKDAVFDL